MSKRNGRHNGAAPTLPPRMTTGESLIEQTVTSIEPPAEASTSAPANGNGHADDSAIRNPQSAIRISLPPPMELPEGYIKRFPKVEANLANSPDLQAAFRRLFYSLHQRDIRLADGRHVDNGADVIRYLLEQYATATAAG